MEDLLQYTFNGLGKGAVYASLALALVIVFRSTGLVNFAQGEMAMFSTFIIWWLSEDVADLPLWAATLVAMALSFVGAAAIERFLVRPVGNARHNPLAVVIVTIGLFLAFNQLAPYLWGGKSRPGIPLASGGVEIVGANMTYQSLYAMVILAVEVVLLWLLFTRTKLGLAMRGVASNAESCELVGVPVGRMLMIGWGLAAAIGAVAGLLSADIGVDASIMQVPLIYAFAAATLGGFDSPVGAVVGGIVVGLVSELSAAYIDAIGQDLRLLPAFVLILVVLMVRPQGLFGKAEVSRV